MYRLLLFLMRIVEHTLTGISALNYCTKRPILSEVLVTHTSDHVGTVCNCVTGVGSIAWQLRQHLHCLRYRTRAQILSLTQSLTSCVCIGSVDNSVESAGPVGDTCTTSTASNSDGVGHTLATVDDTSYNPDTVGAVGNVVDTASTTDHTPTLSPTVSTVSTVPALPTVSELSATVSKCDR